MYLKGSKNVEVALEQLEEYLNVNSEQIETRNVQRQGHSGFLPDWRLDRPKKRLSDDLECQPRCRIALGSNRFFARVSWRIVIAILHPLSKLK